MKYCEESGGGRAEWVKRRLCGGGEKEKRVRGRLCGQEGRGTGRGGDGNFIKHANTD